MNLLNIFRTLSAAKIALIYLVIAVLWILFTDRILAHFVTDTALLTTIQTLKGWLYVGITSVGLYALIQIWYQSFKHDKVRYLEMQRLAIIGDWEYEIATDSVKWSPTMFDIFERDPKKGPPPYQILMDRYFQQSDESLEEIVKSVIATNISYKEDLQLTTEQGNIKYVRALISTIKDKSDQVKGVYGIIHDITDSIEHELELQKRNNFIEQTLNNLPIGVAVNTIDDGQVYLMNEQFSEIYGWPKDTLKDVDSFFDVVYPSEEYRREIKRKVLTDMASGEVERMNWQRIPIVTQDGEQKYVDNKAIPVLDQNLMISTVMDVTKNVEDESRWENLVQNDPDLILIIQDLEIKFLNNAGARMYGAPPEYFIGKSLFEIIKVEKETIARERIAKVIKGEQVEPIIHNILGPDGKYRYLQIKSVPVKYQGKNAVQIVGTDLTKQINAQSKLEESLQEKEVLLQEIHHRVKNNLAVVSGFLQLQQFSSSNSELDQVLTESITRIKSIALIHEKLYMAESLSDIDFKEYIEDLISGLEDGQIIAKNVSVHLNIEPLTINVNQAVPCALILNELIVNSVKHAFDENGGKIQLNTFQKENKVFVEVSDNGKGLPANFLTTNDGSMGSVIIQTLISQLDATIEVSNDDGAMIQFSFEKSNIKGISSTLGSK